VRRWVVDAYDNIPPDETAAAFDALWDKGASRTVERLIEIASAADRLESAIRAGALQPEDAADELRVVRSRLRIVSKDALFGRAPGLLDWLKDEVAKKGASTTTTTTTEGRPNDKDPPSEEIV